MGMLRAEALYRTVRAACHVFSGVAGAVKGQLLFSTSLLAAGTMIRFMYVVGRGGILGHGILGQRA
jgi:hypothetical protein